MNPATFIKLVKTYPAASASAVAIILLILVGYVRGMSYGDLNNRYDQGVRNWNLIEQNVFQNSLNIESHIESAESISQDVRERLVNRAQLAQNYQYFYLLEASTGVRIGNLQQQPVAPQPPARRRGSARQEEKPPFSKVGYNMTIRGSYPQMLGFLNALENGQHFYKLRNLSLQRSDESDGRDIAITMNFELLGRP